MEMNYRMLSVLEKHTDFSTLLHYIARLLPVWAAVLLGLVVGWAWRPKWVSLLVLGIRSRSRLLWTSPPGLGGRRIWLAITAFTAFQILRDFWFNFKAWKWPFYQSEERSASQPRETRPQLVQSIPKCQVECNEHLRQDFVNAVQYVIGDRDLRDLQQRFLCNEGGLPWELMMNKATPGMSYQAWRRDPQVSLSRIFCYCILRFDYMDMTGTAMKMFLRVLSSHEVGKAGAPYDCMWCDLEVRGRGLA